MPKTSPNKSLKDENQRFKTALQAIAYGCYSATVCMQLARGALEPKLAGKPLWQVFADEKDKP